MIVNKILYPNI